MNRPAEESTKGVAQRRLAQIEDAYAVTDALLDLDVPVVAALQGRCAGAGLALALACDLRVATSSATFSLEFVRLGLVPDMGLCWLLAPAIGGARRPGGHPPPDPHHGSAAAPGRLRGRAAHDELAHPHA